MRVNRVGRAIAYAKLEGSSPAAGVLPELKGEMGKVRTSGASFAITTIDCRRLGAMAALAFECALIWAILAPSHTLVRTASSQDISLSFQKSARESLSQAAAWETGNRTLYPYSVIPGGATSGTELRSAVAHDGIVARHYADFDVEKTRVTRLRGTRAFFVSYRIGNRIFWTKNRMPLPDGETVLTDGTHLARTRCGNRLSEAPGEPVLRAEPSPDAMEVAAGGPLAILVPTPEIPLSAPPTTGIVVPETPPGSIFIPPIVPIFPIGGGPFPPGVPSSPTPPGGPAPPAGPPPTPIATPEPSSFLMLAPGLMCLRIFRRRKPA